jgi:hypothetical protein
MDAGPTLPPMPEPYVSADIAASHVGLKRRFLLALAREGIAGAYPLGLGPQDQRHTWVFRLSELCAAIAERKSP